jgi:hypothetical protein
MRKGKSAMLRSELELRALERARTERIRVVKLDGEGRYLARSRTVEPGAYYELTVGARGHIRCGCRGFAFYGVCKHAAAVAVKLGIAL